jgi:predicted nucleic acid-binding Zn ribbon protein
VPLPPPPVTRRDSAAGRPQPLSDVLARFLDRSGLAPKLEAASVIPEWEERVGPAISAVTEPVRVSDGTLFVAVSTSAWMMELNMMKAQLMRRINAGKGKGKISGIVFLMSGQETDKPAPVRRHG